MTGREKLIKTLESAESAIYWSSEDKNFIEKIADHLIANDVVPVVRCKDCKHWKKDALACDTLPWANSYEHANWYADDFCSYGERRTDG